MSVPFSVLDLSPIPAGSDAGHALRNSRDLAQHAERLGYRRYWLAEHHNMPGIASAATAVAIAYVAEGTATIRVGSGGIMLPNHSPLVVAEQFGTLAALYPGRIDLGLGRAPGTDPGTARALRRDPRGGASFADDVAELQGFFAPPQPGQPIVAVPGAGVDVPVWLLGSSLYSARLAAASGLPFAFASHFAPALLVQALRLYRAEFRPSAALAAPYAAAGLAIVVADTDEEAEVLFSSQQQQTVNLHRGAPTQLPPPVAGYAASLQPWERAFVDERFSLALAGAPSTVEPRLAAFLARTGIDELIVTAQVYDHAARVRSYALLAGIRDRLSADPSPSARPPSSDRTSRLPANPRS